MKKIVIILSFVSIMLFLLFVPAFSTDKKTNSSPIIPVIKADGVLNNEIIISADKAILMDKETGIVLYSKNADKTSGIASTTKIMTCIIAIEKMSLSELITITKDSVGIEGSSIYLAEGEVFTLYDLLIGLMLESGNDAANAIAIKCSGSVLEFAELMNSKAKELGMENTNFTNPHGLSDKMHFSTARDMAILSRYAMENDIFREIVGLEKYNIKPQNSEYIRYCRNHNKLLGSYDGVTGIKTGYTKADGRCLASSVERDENELICVTLNSPDHWNDHKALYKVAFESLKKRTLANKGEYAFEISVVGGKENFVTVVNNSKIELNLPDNVSTEIKVVLPPFVYADIKENDIIGELRVYCNNKIIYTTPLCSIENIAHKKTSFFKKFFS